MKHIYQRYLQAFKKGAYNYIKEELDPLTQQNIPRKYFSGGMDLAIESGLTRFGEPFLKIVDKATLAEVEDNGRNFIVASSAVAIAKPTALNRLENYLKQRNPRLGGCRESDQVD